MRRTHTIEDTYCLLRIPREFINGFYLSLIAVNERMSTCAIVLMVVTLMTSLGVMGCDEDASSFVRTH